MIIMSSQLIHLSGIMVWTFSIGGVLDDAVGESHAVRGGFLGGLRGAVAELAKGGAELLWHGVVDDRVDGAVQVDAEATEEQEPGVQVGVRQEGVDHHQGAIGHPQQSEENHHYSQHLCHLHQNN